MIKKTGSGVIRIRLLYLMVVTIASATFAKTSAQMIFDIDAHIFTSKLEAEDMIPYNSGNIVRNAYCGLGTNLSQCAFDDIIVQDLAGNVRFHDSFFTSKVEWNYMDGNWSISNGRLVQSHEKTSNPIEICYVQTGTDCTIGFNAIKESGTNGFVFIMSFTDKDNFVRWDIGCENNTKSKVEQSINGHLTTLASLDMALVTNKAYAIEAQMNGDYVSLYIDGVLIHQIELTDSPALSATATMSDNGKYIDVTINNPTEILQSVSLRVINADIESAASVTDNEYGHNEYPITLVDATGLNTSVTASTNTTIRLALKEPVATSITAQELRNTQKGNEASGIYDLSGRTVRSGYKGIVIKNGIKYLLK